MISRHNYNPLRSEVIRVTEFPLKRLEDIGSSPGECSARNLKRKRSPAVNRIKGFYEGLSAAYKHLNDQGESALASQIRSQMNFLEKQMREYGIDPHRNKD